MEVTDNGKHSSLFQYGVDYGRKKFCRRGPKRNKKRPFLSNHKLWTRFNKIFTTVNVLQASIFVTVVHFNPSSVCANDTMTFLIMNLLIMNLLIITLLIMTLFILTLLIMTLLIMTLLIITLLRL